MLTNKILKYVCISEIYKSYMSLELREGCEEFYKLCQENNEAAYLLTECLETYYNLKKVPLPKKIKENPSLFILSVVCGAITYGLKNKKDISDHLFIFFGKIKQELKNPTDVEKFGEFDVTGVPYYILQKERSINVDYCTCKFNRENGFSLENDDEHMEN